MASHFKDTALADLVHLVSGGKFFVPTEKKAGFQIPEKYLKKESITKQIFDSPGTISPSTTTSEETNLGRNQEKRSEQDEEKDAGKKDDVIIVDWYGEDDLDNPKNWPFGKKVWATFIICFMTTSIYMGSSIVAPAIPEIATYFGVGMPVSALSITLFVWGYGVGPLFLSPITEIPAIGRTYPYIFSILVFVALQPPTILSTNVQTLMILRFFAGFVGSPVLATGGATIGDIWPFRVFAYPLGLWGASAAAGPVLGPVIGSFATQALGWRWSLWPLLFSSGAALVLAFIGLPETSSSNILLKRAKRLRALTSNNNLKSEGEVISEHMTMSEVGAMTLYRPFKLMLVEPIIFFLNLHIALVYAVLYCFFEAFPLLYQGRHGFGLGVSGLPYIAIIVGTILTFAGFAYWNSRWITPKIDNGTLTPEDRLYPACVGAVCLPICLFWFGWTSFSSIHWIVPTISTSLFAVSIFLLFQGILTNLGESFPRYLASVYTSNDFFRSALAGAFPLFANQMFTKLTIQGGCSLLGGLALLMVPIPFVLIKYGPQLRTKSPYSGTGEEKPQENKEKRSSQDFQDLA